jgi:DNA-binding XRE family transcriptional regulator
VRRRVAIDNTIGRRAFRLQQTDAHLAARAGISRAELNRIKNSRVVPRVDTAIAIAAALGCRVRDVFALRPEHRRRRSATPLRTNATCSQHPTRSPREGT